MLKKEMETNFQHFNVFKDYINPKLDANKDENDYEKKKTSA